MQDDDMIEAIRRDGEQTVKTSRKFKSAERFAPWFWDRADEGMSNKTTYDDDRPIYTFKIGPEDIEVFPELEGVDLLFLWKDDSGFVCTREVRKD